MQATTQPQITTQLQPQKVTTVQQQQQPVQQKVIPVSVQKTTMPRVQVIKQETSKPVVTTVPQVRKYVGCFNNQEWKYILTLWLYMGEWCQQPSSWFFKYE